MTITSSLWIFVTITIYGVAKAQNSYFRKDYTYNPDTASFYKVHRVAQPWFDAKVRCQREGATLFIPDTQAEAQYATELLKEKLTNFDAIWTGISDLISEGDFEPLSGKLIEDVYLDWDNGQPDNAGPNNNEDCVAFSKNTAKMDDRDCLSKVPFMCKKTLASVEWNPLCDMPDINYIYNGELGKCYKFHLRPLDWTDAHAVCIAEQSYLAVINSQKEANFLVKMTADAPKDRFKGKYLPGAVHLGFHKQFGEGFTTVTGVPLEESGYHVWGGGQPDHKDTEFCGSMFYNGGLNDILCKGNVCFFICEHDIGTLGSAIDEKFGDN